jgi:hypothetical protein
VFENRVLRIIFGSKTDEKLRGCKNGIMRGVNSLYSFSDIIRIIQYKDDEIGRVCSTDGEEDKSDQTWEKKVSKECRKRSSTFGILLSAEQTMGRWHSAIS